MPAEPKYSAPDPREVDPRTVRRAFSRAAATFDAAALSTSATTTLAPSSVNTRAASAPIPPPAPVITQTLSFSRLMPSSRTRS